MNATAAELSRKDTRAIISSRRGNADFAEVASCAVNGMQQGSTLPAMASFSLQGPANAPSPHRHRSTTAHAAPCLNSDDRFVHEYEGVLSWRPRVADDVNKTPQVLLLREGCKRPFEGAGIHLGSPDMLLYCMYRRQRVAQQDAPGGSQGPWSKRSASRNLSIYGITRKCG